MGIKGAKRLMGVSVLSLLLATPVCAQDTDSVDKPRSSADSSADKGSDVDRTTTDRDDVDIDRPAVVRDDRKSTPKPRLGVRARSLDDDSDQDVDNDGRDRRDNVDHDGIEDQDKPKNTDKKKQDVAKKEAPKNEAPKKDDAAKKDPAAKDASAKKPGDCVDVKSEARFSGLGYDHLVTLKSSCKKRMQCIVRTNVNSDPANVTLDPGEEETLLTWRGSPAREFTPEVKCN